MKQNDRNFIIVLLVTIIACAGIGVLIIKSGESYDPVLYSEVYDELEEIESYFANTNTEHSETLDEDIETFDNYNRQGKIIAILTIDKLGVKYPILKEMTDENLKVAPTKFWGADPNEIGNLCIAGHNYGNAKYFSKLNKLSLGDMITVMDTKGENVSYKVYSKEVINENDLECTSQLTNGKKEVTLITCTDKKNQRLAVKCIEV